MNSTGELSGLASNSPDVSDEAVNIPPFILAVTGLQNSANALAKGNYYGEQPILFEQALKELKKKQDTTPDKLPTQKERIALSERWVTIKQTKQWQSLTRGEIRDLLSIPDVFSDPVVLELITTQLPLNKRLLTTILRSYVSHWEFLDATRQDWGRLIAKSLEDPGLIQRHWPAFHHWREISSWLLAETAPAELAKHILCDTGPLLESVRDTLQLENCSSDKGSLTEVGRQVLLQQLFSLDSVQFEEYLDQALEYWVQPTVDYEWLGTLIKIHKSGKQNIVERITNWFLKTPNFRDPRLNPHGGWHQLDEKAREIFTGWLSKEDLEFFFTMVLPERDDPHKRREFWEYYLPCVLRSRVLLSTEDRERNWDALQKMKSEKKVPPGFCKGSSVFIMEIKNAYILEFSETGNAAYIYWKHETEKYPDYFERIESLLNFVINNKLTAANLRVGTKIPLLSGANDCRDQFTIRASHFNDWQYHLKRWLTSKGIHPDLCRK